MQWDESIRRERSCMLALDDIHVGTFIIFFDGDQIHLLVLPAVHDIVWIKVVSDLSRDEGVHQAHERCIDVLCSWPANASARSWIIC